MLYEVITQKKIEDNPYILTSISGIGFKRADEIALKLGVGLKSERRIGAAMDDLLLQLSEQEGNSAVDKKDLYTKLDTVLEFYGEDALYEQVLLDRINEGSIKQFASGLLSPQRLYEAESFLFETFTRRAKERNNFV